MPQKQFVLEAGSLQPITITVYKRKSSRSLKLSLSHSGEVRVSIPIWASYIAGVQFAKARTPWIREHLQLAPLLKSGQAIGKANHLQFISSTAAVRITTRINDNLVTITFPKTYSETDPAVQKAAERAAIRALRAQAQLLLPQRLQKLAEQYDFEYSSLAIKQLKGRWGSCDQRQNIVLNLFLMELPWECIDYVMLHELTHTRLLKHGPQFWEAMEQVLPNVQQLRKIMRQQRPLIGGRSTV